MTEESEFFLTPALYPTVICFKLKNFEVVFYPKTVCMPFIVYRIVFQHKNNVLSGHEKNKANQNQIFCSLYYWETYFCGVYWILAIPPTWVEMIPQIRFSIWEISHLPILVTVEFGNPISSTCGGRKHKCVYWFIPRLLQSNGHFCGGALGIPCLCLPPATTPHPRDTCTPISENQALTDSLALDLYPCVVSPCGRVWDAQTASLYF